MANFLAICSGSGVMLSAGDPSSGTAGYVGTGELEGITGVVELSVTESGHHVRLRYRLP